MNAFTDMTDREKLLLFISEEITSGMPLGSKVTSSGSYRSAENVLAMLERDRRISEHSTQGAVMAKCPACNHDLAFVLDQDDWDRLGEEHVCPRCKAALVVGQDYYVSIADGTEENFVTLEIRRKE